MTDIARTFSSALCILFFLGASSCTRPNEQPTTTHLEQAENETEPSSPVLPSAEDLVVSGSPEEVLAALTRSYGVVADSIGAIAADPTTGAGVLKGLEADLFDAGDFDRYSRAHPSEQQDRLRAAALVLLVFGQSTLDQRAQYWRRSQNGTWPAMAEELRDAIVALDDACMESFPLGYPEALEDLRHWPTARCWPAMAEDDPRYEYSSFAERPRDLPEPRIEAASGTPTLSATRLREHLARNEVALLACIERRAEEPAGEAGSIVLRFRISESGRVTESVVESSGTGAEQTSDCLAEAIEAIRFVLPEGASEHLVTYTIVAQPRRVPEPWNFDRPPYLMDDRPFSY